MYCPKCNKPLPKGSTSCRHCGAVFLRPGDDRLARKMTVNGRFAMVCGGLMILLALVLFIYGGASAAMQGILLVLGLALIYLGKKIR